jgi:monoamine oxidase
MLTRPRIAIVGGGLAGLVAAWRIEQRGIGDCLILEAGDRLGGRIETVSATIESGAAPTMPSDAGRFDLGATWFWPTFQPELDRLIDELGLTRFAQPEDGEMMVERAPQAPPGRTRGYASGSMRIAGGMGALVEAVRARLATTRIVTGAPVRRIRLIGARVELETDGAGAGSAVWQADHVLLALPPRLVAGTIEFTPALPAALAESWRDTATWMAPHAKYLAVYDAPFWRAAGLSGEARSARGPLAEIHDASSPGGPAALFGFLGVPADTRERVADEVLRHHCRAQLARLFGPLAAVPRAEFVRDWARVSTTASVADRHGTATHGAAPPARIGTGPWRDRLVGIASEWSASFPGYVAGAIEAAGLGVAALAAIERRR